MKHQFRNLSRIARDILSLTLFASCAAQPPAIVHKEPTQYEQQQDELAYPHATCIGKEDPDWIPTCADKAEWAKEAADARNSGVALDAFLNSVNDAPFFQREISHIVFDIYDHPAISPAQAQRAEYKRCIDPCTADLSRDWWDQPISTPQPTAETNVEAPEPVQSASEEEAPPKLNCDSYDYGIEALCLFAEQSALRGSLTGNPLRLQVIGKYAEAKDEAAHVAIETGHFVEYFEARVKVIHTCYTRKKRNICDVYRAD
jgi:hypothetical protein